MGNSQSTMIDDDESKSIDFEFLSEKSAFRGHCHFDMESLDLGVDAFPSTKERQTPQTFDIDEPPEFGIAYILQAISETDAHSQHHQIELSSDSDNGNKDKQKKHRNTTQVQGRRANKNMPAGLLKKIISLLNHKESDPKMTLIISMSKNTLSKFNQLLVQKKILLIFIVMKDVGGKKFLKALMSAFMKSKKTQQKKWDHSSSEKQRSFYEDNIKCIEEMEELAEEVLNKVNQITKKDAEVWIKRLIKKNESFEKNIGLLKNYQLKIDIADMFQVYENLMGESFEEQEDTLKNVESQMCAEDEESEQEQVQVPFPAIAEKKQKKVRIDFDTFDEFISACIAKEPIMCEEEEIYEPFLFRQHLKERIFTQK